MAVLLVVAAGLAVMGWTTRPAASEPILAATARTPLQARGGSIHRAFPEEIDPGARYVIYLHGRIIEDEGVRPTHPQFGVYEYEAILEKLAGHGLQVIAEVRPPGANGAEYARRTAQQVRDLIVAGVPEDHITVMGFSKGGGIAILA